MAVPLAGITPRAPSVVQREPSLLGVLARAAFLAVGAWLVVAYLVPILFELSAAPYR
jgi:hypothetical protein